MSSPPRVILLGASNLTRGISTVIQSARLLLGSPLEVLAALGHGRSYGAASSVCGRRLEGILQSGLWPALEAAGGRAGYALITDIGNDIVYGYDVPEIAGWVERCLERLAAAGARVVVTRPPMASLRTLGPLRFGVARRLIFPRRSLDLESGLRLARELDEAIGELAASAGATLVEPPLAWYGWDPIHMKMSLWPQAWPAILRHWCDGEAGACHPGPSMGRWLRLRLAQPEHRWLIGREIRTPQPACTLPDGTTVALY